MIQAIIIDDEIHCTETLSEKIKLFCPDVEIINTYNDPIVGLKALQNTNIDILFLDIDMPRLNGFALIEKLKDFKFEIIFTTAYDHYAIKAFKISAFDYLLKPVGKEELINCISKIKTKKNTISATNVEQIKILLQHAGNTIDYGFAKIAMPTIEGIEYILIVDIIYIEALSNYSKIYKSNGTNVVVSKTLKELEESLLVYKFYRIHHSYLINMHYLIKYIKGEGGQVVLQNGVCLDVSRRKKDDFLKQMETF